MERPDVFRVIENERVYQDAKWPAGLNPLPPSDELRLVRHILNMVDKTWYDTEDLIIEGTKVNPADLDAIRKVATICVRCMEHHGAVQRGSLDIVGNPHLPV